MKFENVLELIKTVSNSKVTSFQYEEGETKIFIKTKNDKEYVGKTISQGVMPLETYITTEVETKTNSQKAEEESVSFEGDIITSPLVGTFYTSPSEEAEAFVKVGDVVKKGQTLAIVEAMKLMNEIESDFDGVVTAVLAENGKGVEYGQPLFAIK